MRMVGSIACSLLITLCHGADVVQVLPLTDRILMVHFDEGHVVHHGKGQRRTEVRVVIRPLNTQLAIRTDSYRIISPDDPNYLRATNPVRISRKSKGTDFAWMVERWENNRTINTSPDHTKEHWLYLHLANPMVPGRRYRVSLGALSETYRSEEFTFDTRRLRSEAVHVNTVGYSTLAPRKIASLHHWMGDGGSLDLRALEGRNFYLLELPDLRPAFTGTISFRKSRENQETGHINNAPPHGNFLKADVWECDFSDFNRPGRYVVSVPQVGTSFPFEIGEDVYREVFRTVTRGLYHNRSGIALKRPYTEFERPAPHNPRVTPGFAGKLVYTTSRFIDWVDANHSEQDKAAIEAGIKGPIDAWGFYQDAGDWDSYASHLRVPIEMMFVFEMRPANFADRELNIPESGNGLPDFLDEAAWLPRFCHRLRQELLAKGYGTGGLGLRICGDHFGSDGEGVPSYLDVNRQWIASGEDPVSTFGYAGVAAHMALCLQILGKDDPEGVDWRKEAIDSFAWAKANTQAKDEAAVKANRAYAAANLFRLTGDRAYERQLIEDTKAVQATSLVWNGDAYGLFAYVLPGAKVEPDADTLKRLTAAVLFTADSSLFETAERRALRWGGNFWFPMLVGHQTTPWVLEGAVAATLTAESEPDRSSRYLAALYTTADYFLGNNALNTTWITGVGPRHPQHVFHMDAWYNGKGKMHPGLIPYGPWLREREFGVGPWDEAWPHKTVYPEGIDNWPGNERWFDNRNSPLNSEFTVHQNLGPAAAIFGFLSGKAR